ncbi:MAG: energy-coupling factor transporter transmembrane component T [Acutalibacteraceae bacterium]
MTGFKDVHPITSFIFFAVVFTVSLVCSHPIILFTSLFCALSYDIKLRGKKTIKYFFFFLLPMMILITGINGLFSHYGVTVLFVMKSGNNFTLEAVIYGLVFAVKAASVMLWLDCFNEIVTGEKFIYLFGRISPRAALILSMVLRFIPLLRTEGKEIETARKGIGVDAENGKLLKRLKNASGSLSILITRAIENAAFTSDSMAARGYGLHGRTSFNRFVFSKRDGVLTSLSIVFVVIFSCSFKKLSAVYNPAIDISKPDIFTGFLCLIFAVFCLEGMIIDFREESLWKKSE